MSKPPLNATIIPVTQLQQNCTLLWCTETMRGAFVDPGGELDRLKTAAAQSGATIEKILVTHGHMDHCGQATVSLDTAKALIAKMGYERRRSQVVELEAMLRSVAAHCRA